MLDGIESPRDLRRRNEPDLQQIADELRTDTIRTVAETGGHLGASLGVIELTIALHCVFNTPRAVGVTAGASAPEELAQGVVDWLKRLRPAEVSTLDGLQETIEFRLPAELARA